MRNMEMKPKKRKLSKIASDERDLIRLLKTIETMLLVDEKKIMKRTKMKIRNFLKKRGFERMERNHYANDRCSVNMDENYISIADNRGDNVIVPVSIYAVIGVLIYWGYIEKFAL